MLFYISGVLHAPEVRFEGTAQGTTYHISYLDEEQRNLKVQVDSIFTEIDKSLSTYRTDSEISTFNQFGAFRFQSVHFYPVLQKAYEVYKATNGAFDPTIMPLTEAYRKGKATGKPWLHQVDSLLQYVGFQYITFDKETVQSSKEHVRLDLDGIAQGYTVDVIAAFLETKGIVDYVVEVGGELRCTNTRTVSIEDPTQPDGRLALLKLNNLSMTTAGNYNDHYSTGGQTFNHILHPKKGIIQSDLLSVTIIAKDGITADAYDTACIVLGLEETKKLLAEHPELDAYLVYRGTGGAPKVFMTEGVKRMLVN
ncbi:thiamine biosynthesis lipoprotein [Chitinophaga niabensis]|uniref:FAD:protein FMN transferase n=1 Tax=Chitinophaga niabensis TaxID=536979 RepID=A0A1N6J0Z7_9BACT|nr:thiamine biosynthesis lipoprotein [Chitinophaga niabensis]